MKLNGFAQLEAMKSVQLRDVVTKLCGLWMRIQPQLNPWSPLGVSIVWVANSVATSVFWRIGVEVLNFDTLKSPMNFQEFSMSLCLF